jgi:benzodiazapine receptor
MLSAMPAPVRIGIALGVGISASLFTRPEIKGWYATLHKPGFTPPPWLFGPVWTVLYIMMAVAAYEVWKRRNESAVYACSKANYIIQLILNFLWSFTFFYLHQPVLALVVIISLVVSISGTLFYFGKIYRAAAWLLVPYLLWVGFATALNGAIVMLNT